MLTLLDECSLLASQVFGFLLDGQGQASADVETS